jgi:hypothetical protein
LVSTFTTYLKAKVHHIWTEVVSAGKTKSKGWRPTRPPALPVYLHFKNAATHNGIKKISYPDE